MTGSLLDIRCLFLLFALAQCVSLFKLYPFDDDHSDLTSLSFNEKLNSLIHNNDIGSENGEHIFLDAAHTDDKDNTEAWQVKDKRFVQGTRVVPTPHRRNNRPHWNPLVAAYKRCGEFITPEKRESCFKDAIQMLFVHKLRK